MISDQWTIFVEDTVWWKCILFAVTLVNLQVSVPYISTEFTFELNSRTMVCWLITIELRMFLSCIKAPLVLLNLVFTSASVPSCLSSTLPRYVEDSTSSKVSPSSCSFLLAWFFNLCLFLCKFELLRKCEDFCWCWLCDKSVRSSAKYRSSSRFFSVHWILLFCLLVAVYKIQCMARKNRNADSKQPCLTPVDMKYFSQLPSMTYPRRIFVSS